MPGYRKSARQKARERNYLPFVRRYPQNQIYDFSAQCVMGMYPMMNQVIHPGMGMLFPPGIAMLYAQHLGMMTHQLSLQLLPELSQSATQPSSNLVTTSLQQLDLAADTLSELPASETPTVVQPATAISLAVPVTQLHESLLHEAPPSEPVDQNAESSQCDTESLTESTDEEIRCVICLASALKPCNCDTCSAVCCYICIDVWLKKSGTCPLCRTGWDILIEPTLIEPQ